MRLYCVATSEAVISQQWKMNDGCNTYSRRVAFSICNTSQVFARCGFIFYLILALQRKFCNLTPFRSTHRLYTTELNLISLLSSTSLSEIISRNEKKPLVKHRSIKYKIYTLQNLISSCIYSGTWRRIYGEMYLKISRTLSILWHGFVKLRDNNIRTDLNIQGKVIQEGPASRLSILGWDSWIHENETRML